MKDPEPSSFCVLDAIGLAHTHHIEFHDPFLVLSRPHPWGVGRKASTPREAPRNRFGVFKTLEERDV